MFFLIICLPLLKNRLLVIYLLVMLLEKLDKCQVSFLFKVNAGRGGSSDLAFIKLRQI